MLAGGMLDCLATWELLLFKRFTVQIERVGPEEERSPTEAEPWWHPSLGKQCKEQHASSSSRFHLQLLKWNCVKQSLLTRGGELRRWDEDTPLLSSLCCFVSSFLCALCQIRCFEHKYKVKADTGDCLETGTWASLLWFSYFLIYLFIYLCRNQIGL